MGRFADFTLLVNCFVSCSSFLGVQVDTPPSKADKVAISRKIVEDHARADKPAVAEAAVTASPAAAGTPSKRPLDKLLYSRKIVEDAARSTPTPPSTPRVLAPPHLADSVDVRT